jgi:osmotically-inducible protein OsmY
MLRLNHSRAAPGRLHSPTDLAEWAEGRLRSNAYLALKNISCEVEDGVLTLRGCLPSYYLKQVAQETLAPLEGLAQIDNQIAVVAPGPREVHRN